MIFTEFFSIWKSLVNGLKSVVIAMCQWWLKLLPWNFLRHLLTRGSYEGVTVYVAAADVPEELLAQKTVSFKDEEWFVLSSACDCGLKTIQLYRERA